MAHDERYRRLGWDKEMITTSKKSKSQTCVHKKKHHSLYYDVSVTLYGPGSKQRDTK